MRMKVENIVENQDGPNKTQLRRNMNSVKKFLERIKVSNKVCKYFIMSLHKREETEKTRVIVFVAPKYKYGADMDRKKIKKQLQSVFPFVYMVDEWPVEGSSDCSVVNDAIKHLENTDFYKENDVLIFDPLNREKEELDEKWSEKYKKSINCNNPKGFSQRAHCQGRKKRKKMNENNMKRRIINESGIRDIKAIAKRYPKAKIYFHMDLDGVATAIAMKQYLENQGIKVVDAELIQYGDKEFAVKKLDAEGDIMPVLVDFAHGKPMFVIHTDHHDTQAGVEKGTATSFKASRSNVETISQTLSPKEIFTQDDLTLISTVDSANFIAHDISFNDVMNFLFKLDKDKSVQRNKMMLGLVTNKLLLTFKNKPNFLRDLVMNSTPSILNILTNIKKWMKENGINDVSELQKNQQDYIERMKEHPNVEDKIIVQYGGGSMVKPGSYDRYTPFKNNPDADFLVIAWPSGMVQSSCNAYKGDRALKGVNLGEIKDEVLNNLSPLLMSSIVSFGTLKRISEKNVTDQSVGFTMKDLFAIYSDADSFTVKDKSLFPQLDELSKKLYKDLTFPEKKLFDSITINGLDVIKSNSGGHKCITNISGINYLFNEYRSYKKEPELEMIQKYNGRNKFVLNIQDKLRRLKRNETLSPKQITVAVEQIQSEVSKGWYNPESQNRTTSYVEVIKKIQDEFVKVLKSKIYE